MEQTSEGDQLAFVDEGCSLPPNSKLNSLCFSLRPLFALLIFFAEWVVLLLGTARTQGGRSSLSASSVLSGTSDASVGRRKEGRAGRAAADERMREEVDAVGEARRLEVVRAKIGEGDQRERMA